MRYQSKTTRRARALTLLEMVIAVSAMTVVLMTLLPALAGIRNSWDTRQGNAQIMQNARVLADHVSRRLSTAARITDVSAPSAQQGYIEFADSSGSIQRYAVDRDGLVEFGPPESGADLAGPVSRFQVTCYDGNDFTTPTTEPGLIQFVILRVTFPNTSHLGTDRNFSCSAYLRSAAINPTDRFVYVPGIAVEESITWGGIGATIDSYCSSVGPYQPAEAGSDAKVSINTVGSDKVVLSAGATVKGDVYVGPGGDPDLGIRMWGGATITGKRGVLEEVVNIPRLGRPVGPAFGGHYGDAIRLSGTATETISSNRHLKDIVLQGSAKLAINGRVTLLVDNRIIVSDEAQLEIAPGASAAIFTGHDIDVDGLARVNDLTRDPSMLRIYLIGDNKDLRMTGRAVVHAVVQNPKGEVHLSGSAQLFGKIKAARLDGGGRIHIDLDCDFGGEDG